MPALLPGFKAGRSWRFSGLPTSIRLEVEVPGFELLLRSPPIRGQCTEISGKLVGALPLILEVDATTSEAARCRACPATSMCLWSGLEETHGHPHDTWKTTLPPEGGLGL